MASDVHKYKTEDYFTKLSVLPRPERNEKKAKTNSSHRECGCGNMKDKTLPEMAKVDRNKCCCFPLFSSQWFCIQLEQGSIQDMLKRGA